MTSSAINPAALDLIAAKIKAFVKSATLTPDTALYAAEDEDGNPTGQWCLSISKYRESTRTYTDAGRAELAAEDAAVRELLAIAAKAGTVTKDSEGSGQYGEITGYLIS